MAEKEVIDYIKQTLSEGFPEEQIRNALKQSGWQDADIEEGFKEVNQPQEEKPRDSFGRPSTSSGLPQNDSGGEMMNEAKSNFFTEHKKMILGAAALVLILIIILIIVVALTGNNDNTTNEEVAPTTEQAPPPVTQTPEPENSLELERQRLEAEAAAARDRGQIRLADIQDLQAALSSYFETNTAYPQNLQLLIEVELINTIPRDPESLEPYIYTSFGDPRIHYALSFLLETDVGLLDAGLQIVTSDKPLSIDSVNNAEAAIQGISTENLSELITITDLNEIPYFPREEITLTIEPDSNLQLAQVFMITDTLRLSDQSVPFRFRFSAPNAPGEFQVNIVGFDEQGASYSQITNFTVRNP